jgi:hypothetical protein
MGAVPDLNLQMSYVVAMVFRHTLSIPPEPLEQEIHGSK